LEQAQFRMPTLFYSEKFSIDRQIISNSWNYY